MYPKLSIALTSTLAMMATALPHGADTDNIASITNEARGRTNFRVCGSRAFPSDLFSLTDQNPSLGGSRSGHRILLKSHGNRATDGVTLAIFPALGSNTGCQLNFVLPQPRSVKTNFAGQAQGSDNANNKLLFTNKVRVDVLKAPGPPIGVSHPDFRPTWNNLAVHGLPVWGVFNLAAPGVQVVNVADCSRPSAFLLRISSDSQTKDFVFDQQSQITDDQNTSLGLFISYNC